MSFGSLRNGGGLVRVKSTEEAHGYCQFILTDYSYRDQLFLKRTTQRNLISKALN